VKSLFQKKFTKEDVEKAIKVSRNFTEVIKTLGIKLNGKITAVLKKYCIENSISTENLCQNYTTREEYEKNPKLCKHCGKPIPWEKRDNDKYCCRSCAASETNTKRPKFSWKNKLSHEELLARRRTRDRINRAKKNKKELKSNDIERIKNNTCPICGQENCTSEFCKKHNLQQLRGFVKHLGFDSTAIGTIRVFDEFERIKKMIYDLYWNQGLSMADLGKRFNYSSKIGHIPENVLESLEIPRRTKSESQKTYLINNPGRRLVFSDKIFEKSLKSENHISWDGKSYFLRSSYEIEYAEYLDGLKILYMVEELRIEYLDSQQNRIRVAIPDFYLPDTNEIIEIKSDFTLDIQEMLDKFEAYKNFGYIPKLILEKEEIDLYDIENKISKERLKRIKTKNIKNFKTK